MHLECNYLTKSAVVCWKPVVSSGVDSPLFPTLHITRKLEHSVTFLGVGAINGRTTCHCVRSSIHAMFQEYFL